MLKRTPRKLPLGALMVDVGGAELTGEERDFLRHPAVGAVILFARNYQNKKQLAELVHTIKSVRAPALLVGVDQEGGRVQRFRDEFYPLPAASMFGKFYDMDADPEKKYALRCAELGAVVMAAELRAVGVDFSFAPVLDCAHPRSEVLGDRALHNDPDIVRELASAYLRGMQAVGMAAVGKHFPGHGGVAADSHTELPTDPRTLRDLVRRDLIPFARLRQRLGGMMTAHIHFPQIHSQLPTYSKFWLQDTLRGQLQFRGVIFSDDLTMRGAGEADIATRGKAALEAGCDIALICNNAAGARATADAVGTTYALDPARAEAMRGRPQSVDGARAITEFVAARAKFTVAAAE